MRDLLVLAAIGLGTYAFRAAFLMTAGARQPAALERVLPYVGPAVLAAITVPMLLAPRGALSLTESLPAAVAAAVTWLLWRRTAGLLVPLLGGLATWSVLAALVPA
jgi:branched-subunit amino acid transport protein